MCLFPFLTRGFRSPSPQLHDDDPDPRRNQKEPGAGKDKKRNAHQNKDNRKTPEDNLFQDHGVALEADLLTWFRVNGYPPEDFEFLVQLSLHVGNDLVDLFESLLLFKLAAHREVVPRPDLQQRQV